MAPVPFNTQIPPLSTPCSVTCTLSTVYTFGLTTVIVPVTCQPLSIAALLVTTTV